jgi:parallel beta-helix repeat protein
MALSIGHTNNTIVFDNNLPYNGRTDIFLREGINLAYSSNNYIIANNITKHSAGIYTLNSSNNYFYLNNIIDNQVQVQEALIEHDWSWLNGSISHGQVFLYFSVNNWDNGSLGNCWSTYKGIDANKDGIGDKAYIVNDENSDKYPLTKEANNQTNSIDIDSLRQLVYQNILPTKKGVPDEPHLYYIIIFALIITVLLVSLSLVIITFKKKIK